jgi:hypothetical protein
MEETLTSNPSPTEKQKEAVGWAGGMVQMVECLPSNRGPEFKLGKKKKKKQVFWVGRSQV